MCKSRLSCLPAILALLLCLAMPAVTRAQATCAPTETVVAGDTLQVIAARCNTTVAAILEANPSIENPDLILIGQEINIPGEAAPDAASEPASADETTPDTTATDMTDTDIAATDEVTTTDTVTATDQVTATNQVTATSDMTTTNGVTATSDITGTDALTGTGEITDTSDMTATADVTSTNNMTSAAEQTARALVSPTMQEDVPPETNTEANTETNTEANTETSPEASTETSEETSAEASTEASTGTTEPQIYIVQPGDWLSRIANTYGTTVEAIMAVNPAITNEDEIEVGQELLIPSGSVTGEAAAGDEGTAEPTVTIAPASGPAGTPVWVAGSGFAPNQPVDIGIGVPESEYQIVQENAHADVSGNVGVIVSMPEDAGIGERWVVAITPDDSDFEAISNEFVITE